MQDTPSPPPTPPTRRRVAFRVFRSQWFGWEQLFGEAAAFATSVGPDRLVSISHPEDKKDGVIAVWYWEEAPAPERVSPLVAKLPPAARPKAPAKMPLIIKTPPPTKKPAPVKKTPPAGISAPTRSAIKNWTKH